MALTKQEEDILKAEVAVRLAREKLHKQKVLMNDEIKAAHKPITDNIIANHKSTLDSLEADAVSKQDALRVLIRK